MAAVKKCKLRCTSKSFSSSFRYFFLTFRGKYKTLLFIHWEKKVYNIDIRNLQCLSYVLSACEANGFLLYLHRFWKMHLKWPVYFFYFWFDHNVHDDALFFGINHRLVDMDDDAYKTCIII